MRVPGWLYRRPSRGWADVKREPEAAGAPRVGVPPDEGILADNSGHASKRSGRRLAGHATASGGSTRVIDEDTIELAARKLFDAAPAGTRLVIFGSHAWGQAGGRSDLDLLVIEPDIVEDPAAEAVRLRRALRGMLLAADILVVSARSATKWRGVPNSLIGGALAEGRELTR